MTAADTARATPDAAQEAAGAIAAQHVIDRLSADWATPDSVWLAFVETAVKSGGYRSTACRAFIHELAKRAAARVDQ